MLRTGACVLVVDDEELIRWALCQRLEERGYRVLQAASARGARRQAEKADLVVIERQLPDGDGRDLAAELRRERPQRPLVLMTADSDPELERSARRRGLDAVAEKPFGLDDMVQLIRRCLGAH
jgi:two-component system nitrogen regulation response regulator GlnG